MKKIILPLLATVWLTAGCGDTGYDVSQAPTFAITSADVEYTAQGGEGTITLDVPPGAEYKVVSEKPWCNATRLQGGKIEIVVYPHGSLQSRESQLPITYKDYTRRVGIFQNGTRFHIASEPGSAVEGTPEVLGYKVGDKIAIPFVVDGDLNVTVESAAEWAAVEWARDTLFVTATEIGTWINPRSGTVKLVANDIPKNVIVTQAERQLEYDSFIGTYKMTAYYTASTLEAMELRTYENITIEADEEGKSFLMKGLDVYYTNSSTGVTTTYPMTIPLKYADGSVSFANGTLVGKYGSDNVTIRLMSNTGGWSATSSYSVYSTYDIVDGKFVLKLNTRHTSSTDYSGFCYSYIPSSGTANTTPNSRWVREILLYQQ